MRIYTAVRHSLDPQFYYGALWASNFHPALRRLGHEVVESRVDLLPGSRFMDVEDSFTPDELVVRGELTERIVDDIKSAHRQHPIDLVLTYFYNSHFDPAGFDEIRRLGIPTVNFYCNNIHQFHLVREIAPAVDFAWHAERDAASKYSHVAANPVWIQMAADPDVYHPIEMESRRSVACFVGARYADRSKWLASLIEADIPLILHGARWTQPSDENHRNSPLCTTPDLGRTQVRAGSPRAYVREIQRHVRRDGVARGLVRTLRQARFRQSTRAQRRIIAPYAGDRVEFDQMIRLFSECEVVLNFSNVWADGRPGSKLTPHVRLRDFEAPMCGACYLTGETDEIREFYDVGREIDTYRTPEELIDKTRFYLANPVAAERLRQAGYRRALADHTWDRRFQQLFRAIGIPT